MSPRRSGSTRARSTEDRGRRVPRPGPGDTGSDRRPRVLFRDAMSRLPRCRPAGARSRRCSRDHLGSRGAASSGDHADDEAPRARFAQIAQAELVLQLRRGENLIVTLAVPLGILVFFSKVDTTIPSDFKHPVDFLVPGVLSLAVMAAAMVSLGIATGFERRYGVLKRLGSTPARGAGCSRPRPRWWCVRGDLGGARCGHRRRARMARARRARARARPLAHRHGRVLGHRAAHGGHAAREANLAAANALFLVLLFLGGMAYPLAKLPGAVQAVAKVAAHGRALRHRAVGALDAGLPDRGSSSVLIAWGDTRRRSPPPAGSAGKSDRVRTVHQLRPAGSCVRQAGGSQVARSWRLVWP